MARGRVLALVVILASVLLPRFLSSQPAALTVLSREGRRTLGVTSIGGQDFVALDDLAAAFQLAVREESLGALTVSYKGRTIVLTPDQPLASVSGRAVTLPAAPVRGPGPERRWLVPVDFVSRALAAVYDAKLDLRRPSRLLVVGDLRVPRVQVRYDPVGTGARLTIDATPRTPSIIAQDGDRLTIRFDADAVDASNLSLQLPAQGVVQAVRVIDAVTLAVDLKPRSAAFKASSQPTDTMTRLTIDLPAAQAEAAAPAPATAQAAPPDSSTGPTSPAGSSIRTVAIDPGHGGDDDGAKGLSGAKEKEIALAVARRAKAAIEARLGIRVVLTREEDRNVPLDARAAVANNSKADLFISLHANASPRPSATGASIYTAAYTTAAFDRDGLRSALGAIAPERLPAAGGTFRDIEFIPWDFAQLRHLERSNALQTILADQFRNRIPLAARATDAAPLRVLEPLHMPAVLVEMGCLTNPAQEKQLAGPEFQTAFVQALVDTVQRFRDMLDRPAGGAQ